MRLLPICAALAAGEFLATFISSAAESWPVFLTAAALVALFGYGLDCRCWKLLAVFLLGVGLFLSASVEIERVYREKPWMRGRERMLRPKERGSPAVARLRRDLSRRIGLGLDGDRETASLGRAILLGERWRMSARARKLFVESGTMHVFAISGLHVMAIADVLIGVLALALVPRRFAGLASVPFLWGYVGLLGFPPSAVRAATMSTFQFLAPVFWRRNDGLRAWSLTFLVIHLIDPTMIVNVGNALSFTVMLSIVLVGDFVRRSAAWQRKLLVTVAAWAVGVPIAAHVFGCVTPGGMLANLVLISAAKLTVMAGAIGLGASYVSECVAAYVNNFCALGIRSMVTVAECVSRLPYANVRTGSWSLSACVAWYAALLTVGAVMRRMRKEMVKL